ncbi:MAG: FliH/SctL family protein [Rhizobacter sp.]|nr:FliH/SctL family protein [Rhizobacter sp.]
MTNSSDARRAPRQVPPPTGGATQKASPYTRFIPREELGSFAAWSPDALSGGVPPPTPLRRATDVPPAGGEAMGAAEALASQLRAARQSGYQDGYRDGLVALDAFKQSYASQVTAQLGALTEGYHAELDALREQLAQAVAATATTLARQVVRSELATRPELIAAVAQEAIDTLLTSARHITLRIHPDDQPLVALGAGDVLAARGARLITDTAMARGGCSVDSDIGAVDATLATRWARAAAALGSEMPWEEDAT